jgi:hypothetical protein
MCAPTEKYAVEERAKEEEQLALAQAVEVGAVVIEGQRPGEHQHGCMGVYELVEGMAVNGRGVWRTDLFGSAGDGAGEGAYVYYGSDQAWWVSTEEDMSVGAAAGWMSVSSIAISPDRVNIFSEIWRVDNGRRWVQAPNLRIRVCSIAEKQAAEERAAEEERLAMAQAIELGDVVVEGQRPGEHQYCCMGVYELVTVKRASGGTKLRAINGRAVWRSVSEAEGHLYFGSTSHKWWVSDTTDMLTGESAGWLRSQCVAGTAVVATAPTVDTVQPIPLLTPITNGADGAEGAGSGTGPWQIDNGRGWADTPSIRVRKCTLAEKQTALETIAEEERRALEQAREVGDITIDGQELGEPQNDKMGVYELVDGMVVNRRAVWRAQGAVPSRFLYSSFKAWSVVCY